MSLPDRKARRLIYEARHFIVGDTTADKLIKELADALEQALIQFPKTVWGVKDTDTEAVFRIPGEANARRIAAMNAPQLIAVSSLKTEWTEAPPMDEF